MKLISTQVYLTTINEIPIVIENFDSPTLKHSPFS